MRRNGVLCLLMNADAASKPQLASAVSFAFCECGDLQKKRGSKSHSFSHSFGYVFYVGAGNSVVFHGGVDVCFGASGHFADFPDGVSCAEEAEEDVPVGEFGVVVPAFHGVLRGMILGRAGLRLVMR